MHNLIHSYINYRNRNVISDADYELLHSSIRLNECSLSHILSLICEKAPNAIRLNMLSWCIVKYSYSSVGLDCGFISTYGGMNVVWSVNLDIL